MHLSPQQIAWLQQAYDGLGNYEDGVLVNGDVLDPINPAKWQAPEGDRLIHVAAQRGDLAAVELLINAGEDVNAIGDMGQTPAHYAASQLDAGVFEFLIKHGASPTIVDEFGNTPTQSWAAAEKRKRWASHGKWKPPPTSHFAAGPRATSFNRGARELDIRHRDANRP